MLMSGGELATNHAVRGSFWWLNNPTTGTIMPVNIWRKLSWLKMPDYLFSYSSIVSVTPISLMSSIRCENCFEINSIGPRDLILFRSWLNWCWRNSMVPDNPMDWIFPWNWSSLWWRNFMVFAVRILNAYQNMYFNSETQTCAELFPWFWSGYVPKCSNGRRNPVPVGHLGVGQLKVEEINHRFFMLSPA